MISYSDFLARHTDEYLVKLIKRFWEKVAIQTEPHPLTGTPCWLWIGGRDRDDYGMFSIDRTGKNGRAHRVSFALYGSRDPEDRVLDHICKVHACVNPEHLRVATWQENCLWGDTLSAANSRKTRCPQGHEYAGDNLMFNRNGGRLCRICELARQRRVKREWRATPEGRKANTERVRAWRAKKRLETTGPQHQLTEVKSQP